MALPFDKWLDIKAGPNVWGMIKSTFRTPQEEESGTCSCGFNVWDMNQRRYFTLIVEIDAVKRCGTYAEDSMAYDLEGKVLFVAGEHLPEDPGRETRFEAIFKPTSRDGSLKVSKQILL